jgi:hypothetical protein
MRRRLLNLLTALSLLLCVAVAALWVRSHLVYEQVGRITPDHGAEVVRSASGRLHFARHSYSDPAFAGAMDGKWSHYPRVRSPKGWPESEYQQPADETLGFARYVGTVSIWPGHFYPGVPINPRPSRADPRWWRDDYRVWVVPHWVLFLATGSLPALWLWRHPPSTWESPLARLRAYFRRRIALARRSAGRCPSCGYDLRATPDLCPECGTIAASPPAG